MINRAKIEVQYETETGVIIITAEISNPTCDQLKRVVSNICKAEEANLE